MSYKELTKFVSGNLRDLKQGNPDLMKGFAALSGAATKAGALDEKTKELLALAIAIAIRCDDCIAFHSQASIRLGMTKEELEELVGVAVMMGGGPSLMYGSHAVAAFKEFSEE